MELVSSTEGVIKGLLARSEGNPPGVLCAGNKASLRWLA